MPLPTPNENEKKTEFITRCLSNETVAAEFVEDAQRNAVCFSQWESGAKEMQVNIKTLSAKTRTETWNGRDYLVLSAVLLTEGVHNDLLYTAEELAKYPSAWNGRPIPIHHPEENGCAISCNSPEVLSQAVGFVFNTGFEKSKLKAELWIDKQKLREKDQKTYFHIQAERPIEISTGLWSDEEVKCGDWNGKPFCGIVYNIRPDHVALLPGAVGACSWKDGCGAPRLNQEKGGIDLKERQEEIQGFWGKVRTFFQINKKSHDQLRQELSALISPAPSVVSEAVPVSAYAYVMEVYDSYFIYSQGEEDLSTVFKQKYKVVEGKASLVDEPTEMVMEFVPLKENEEVVKSEEVLELSTNSGDEIMKEQVDQLIGNAKTAFEESDREWLMSLSTERLDQFVANAPKKAAPVEEKDEELLDDDLPVAEETDTEEEEPKKKSKKKTKEPEEENKEEEDEDAMPTTNKQAEMSLNQVLASKEFAYAVATAVKTLVQKDRKADLAQQVKQLKGLQFTTDEVNAMPESALEKLLKANSGDFSGRGGSSAERIENEAPPEMPSILSAKVVRGGN